MLLFERHIVARSDLSCVAVLDVVSGEFGDYTQQLVDTATNSIWRGSTPKVDSELYIYINWQLYCSST